jgi:tellurite resistance protein
MARRKGSKGGELVLFAIGAVVAAIAAVPKEAWIAIGVIALIGGVVWLLSKANKSSTSTTDNVSYYLEEPKRVQIEVRSTFGKQNKKAPTGPPVAPRWIKPADSVEVASTIIPGGMLYFGSNLLAESGDVDPALIDPKLEVAAGPVDVSIRQMDYWPSYSNITPSARRGYLSWLATGRSNPSADVGYVFLFFYGLERRVLVDAESDVSARNELTLIESEIERLLKIYGQNNSFTRYASSFLDLLVLRRTESNLHTQAPPDRGDQRGHSILSVALGRMAAMGISVPVDWALHWVQNDPRVSLPTALKRCRKQFEKLFTDRYRERFPDGIKLPVNRTKLRISYRPASSGFSNRDYSVIDGDLPDINAVVVPIKKLEAIVEECAEQLAPYSRYVSKDQNDANSLEGLLLLPQSLWPLQASSAMQALNERIGNGLRVMSLGELLSNFGGVSALTRDRVRSLAHALEELHIGIEPDVLAGARAPKIDDRVILFRAEAEDGTLRATPAYQVASVTLDLGCSVAMADGKVHPNELRLLMKQIDSWVQLSGAQRKRLRARLRMSIDEPPSIASVKKKLEQVPQETKRAIAHLLSALAQADGTVLPAEVKHLEKVYKTLGIDVHVAYGDLHVAAMDKPQSTQSAPVVAPAPASLDVVGFTLSAERIAALQKETDAVSALLAGVFVDEVAAPIEEIEERHEAQLQASGCIGLDAEHTSFMRLLITRPSWAREDLADAASDMDLMLDGALERINEAAMDHFDDPLIEGEDPIDVIREIREKIPA